MKIIAESSSTRTEWSLVDGTEVVEHAFTTGINPYFQSRREISHSVRLALPETFFKRRWSHIFFYGAGCANKEKCKIVESSLVAQFKTPVTVESDLLGAARGLLVRKPGLACILGTGSNSCLYNGKEIVKTVAPLGFILGDEGSGAYLGKLLVGDILKNQMTPELKDKFLKQFDLEPGDIIDRVYRKPFPNRFLASLSPFLAQNLHDPCVHTLVLNSFKAFLKRNVMQYDYEHSKVHFIGSVAFHYKEVLAEATQEMGIQLGTILKSPMEGLIRYHS